MRPAVLLVNPPIYDFTAYDFWLRPYGMLRVAGRLQHACAITGFDFLVSEPRDDCGRGRYQEESVARPGQFKDIPRRYRRFGRPREEFRRLLQESRFDAALVQTGMTYWYPGVREVLDDLRELQPQATTVLGGTYAALCPDHARSLGPDLVIEGPDLEPLRQLLTIEFAESLPLWDGFVRGVGVIKLTEGCPFHCTYCSVPFVYPEFKLRPTEECVGEVTRLARLGARHVAFYDDALLFRASEGIIPFLEAVGRERLDLSFHTPNALNARFLTPELARQMVESGVRSFFLGLESASSEWHAATGGKVRLQEFAEAVAGLKKAGARSITAYIIAGHPDSEPAKVEESMRFAHELGVQIMLAEFAPIPGTPDGERCREWIDIGEPLSHNKTAFAIRRLGADRINQLKSLCRELNSASRLQTWHCPRKPARLPQYFGGNSVWCKNTEGERSRLMGVVFVEGTVTGFSGDQATLQFLVDSGATYTLLPQPVWQAIRLTPKRLVRFTLADGTIVERHVSECHIALPHGDGHTPVILGEPGDEALLGAVTLEILGLVLNPFTRTLHPMRMMLA